MTSSKVKMIENVYRDQKKDGTYVYRIRKYNSRTGNSDIRTVVPPEGLTERKLVAFLYDERNKFFRELEGGLLPATARTTFADYFENQFKNSFTGREKTWHDYEGHYTRHMKTWLGRVKIGDINKALLVQYFKYLDQEEKVGASTFNAIYRIMSSILNNAVDDDLIMKNPLNSKVVKKKEVQSKTDALRPEDLDILVKLLEDEPHFWRTLYMLTISTGCRRGEIVGLRWENVHIFEEYSYIEVVHSVEYVPGEGKKLVDPKTYCSRRKIFIPNLVRELLYEEYLQSHSGYVFCSDGVPDKLMHPDTINTHTNRMCKRLGISRFTPHMLRRTFATTLATREKVDPKTLQVILGHADLRTLLKYYVLPSDEIQRNAINDYTKYFDPLLG